MVKKERVLVVRLMGGLGNQMFQFAAGVALSQKMRRTLVLDLSLLGAGKDSSEDQIIRDFELSELFLGPFSLASEWQIHRLYPKNSSLRSRLKSFVMRRLMPSKLYIQNGNLWFDVSDAENDLLGVVGRFQDARYFDFALDRVLSKMKLKQVLSDEGEKLRKFYSENNNFVAVHVRRGDYVDHPVYSKIIGFVGKDYIDSAIEHFKKHLSTPHFIFFSDDPEWCEQNYKDVGEIHTKSFCQRHSHSDFILLSSFKNVIIANSTFSWWAGKIAEVTNGAVIVAPKKWLANNSDSSNPAESCLEWTLL